MPTFAPYFRWFLFVLLGVCGTMTGSAQPERLLYFPDTGRLYSQLEPGDELLQRNLLLSNQSQYNVSFDLSFDQEVWNGFSTAPRYTSLYNMKNQAKCYIRIRTRQRNGAVATVLYELIRGNCYSVYWNKELARWDVVENACRKY